MLEAPAHVLERLGYKGPQLKQKGDLAHLPLRPQGVQDLGILRFPAKFRAELRLVVVLPAEARKRSGWRVAVRQYLPRDKFEVGRVTWYPAAPDFDKRRREVEGLPLQVEGLGEFHEDRAAGPGCPPGPAGVFNCRFTIRSFVSTSNNGRSNAAT